MAAKLTPEQTAFLQQMLDEMGTKERQGSSPAPPARFSPEWGQQPMPLFFHPPMLYHPYEDHIYRGDAWYERGQYQKAYDEYAVAIKGCIKSYRRDMGMQTVFGEQGMLAGVFFGAVNLVIKDRHDNLQRWFIYTRLALAALMLKDFTRCLENATLAIKLKLRQELGAPYLVVALASAAIGRKADAETFYNKALSLNPNFDEYA